MYIVRLHAIIISKLLWISELPFVLISLTGKFFTKYDEELAKTFAVYCGISIYQVRSLLPREGLVVHTCPLLLWD